MILFVIRDRKFVFLIITQCFALMQDLYYLLELGGMTKNLYHGIFLNYTGFTVYDGIYFFHA